MGFRPTPTQYNLTFQGTALDGLHVSIGCCTMGEYNEMIRAGSIDAPDVEITGLSEAELRKLVKEVKEIAVRTMDANDKMIQLLAKYLVSWDLETIAGEAVPTTAEGILSQERTIVSQIMSAWQSAMVTVPPPLKSESTSGGTLEEQSLGLGSISQSPQS